MFFSESESETLALGISMSTYRRLDSDKVSIECHLKLNRCFGAALVRVIWVSPKFNVSDSEPKTPLFLNLKRSRSGEHKIQIIIYASYIVDDQSMRHAIKIIIQAIWWNQLLHHWWMLLAILTTKDMRKKCRKPPMTRSTPDMDMDMDWKTAAMTKRLIRWWLLRWMWLQNQLQEATAEAVVTVATSMQRNNTNVL